MRGPTFVVVSAILVSLATVSQSGVVNDVAPYSIIDPIIKAILEKMKTKLANLKIDDINETVENDGLNATVKATEILIQNADNFVIQSLKSNVVPLKLTNLTLTWDNIVASANYDANANISIPKLTTVNVFGAGKAKATLSGIFFTIGANVELKDKVIQIKPKGLFGFDLSVRKAEVTVSSLMGSQELGNTIGTFISKLIPEFVDTFKKPLFDAFQGELIKVLNAILRKTSGFFAMDEESFESLESNELIPGAVLDWDSDEFPSFSEF